ncbi:hypothetical protein AD936_14810 [Gluconobacter japonicus]|nr:hypothetical protein AD936_14810 [Gluconobacter japonicus]
MRTTFQKTIKSEIILFQKLPHQAICSIIGLMGWNNSINNMIFNFRKFCINIMPHIFIAEDS